MYAVFDADNGDQLSEPMPCLSCEWWISAAYRDGDTRSLVIRLVSSTVEE